MELTLPMDTADLHGDLPDFAGRLVVFYLSDSAPPLNAGILLEYPEFRRFGDRLFVVGRTPVLSDGDWASNLPAAVAWQAVLHYLVFASREDYIERNKRAPDNWLHRLSHRLGN